MKYDEIVEALKEELGFQYILGVKWTAGARCESCGNGDGSILEVKGRSISISCAPTSFEIIYLCADRKACRERAGEQRQESTQAIEHIFVPL